MRQLILLAFLLLAGCDSQPAKRQLAPPAPTTQNLAVLPVPTSPAPAVDSTRTFNWEDVCTNTGLYNPKAYTRRQLTDTYQLVLGTGGLPTSLYLSSTDDKAESFQRLAALLKQQHDSLAGILREKEVVPIAFWHRFKRLRELQLAEQYEQAQVELAAYFAPATLRRSRYYAACALYADALASTDTAVVLRAWRYLITQQKKNNADPAQFDRKYAAAVASPDCLPYATEQLLTFGLHNCLVSSSRYNNLDNQYQPAAQFKKLFRHVRRSNCADTD